MNRKKGGRDERTRKEERAGRKEEERGRNRIDKDEKNDVVQ